MTSLRVIGVDPGPVPGIVVLHIGNGRVQRVDAVQCTVSIAPLLVARLLDAPDGPDAAARPALLAVERFVVGRASMRSGSAGAVTHNLVGQLQALADDSHRTVEVTYVQRSASEVKPWATEMRLASAGLLEPTKGMQHARDAAKHALFAAVHAGAIPDPLSKRGTS